MPSITKSSKQLLRFRREYIIVFFCLYPPTYQQFYSTKKVWDVFHKFFISLLVVLYIFNARVGDPSVDLQSISWIEIKALDHFKLS